MTFANTPDCGRLAGVSEACNAVGSTMSRVPMNLLFDDIEVIESVGDPSSVEVGGITHDSRRVVPGDLFCCVPGSVSDGHAHAAEAVDRGAIGLLCEHFIPELIDQDVVQTRIARGHHAPRHGAAGSRVLRLPGPRPLDGGRDGHEREDDRDPVAGRPAQCGRPPDQCHGDAVGHADDARGNRGAAGAGRRARPPEVRRPTPRRRHGGVEPRAGPVARRGHPLRRRGLHQPEPRPSRLPRDDGGVLRGEGAAVHAEPRAAWRRQRRRPVGPAAPGARPHPDGRRPPRRRQRHRAAPRPLRVHLARAADHHPADGGHQRRQRPAGGRSRAGARGPVPRAGGDRAGHGESLPGPGPAAGHRHARSRGGGPGVGKPALHGAGRLRAHAGRAGSGARRGARAGARAAECSVSSAAAGTATGPSAR